MGNILAEAESQQTPAAPEPAFDYEAEAVRIVREVVKILKTKGLVRRNGPDGDDFGQNLLTKLLLVREKFDPKKANLGAWAMTMGQNLAIDYQRAAQVRAAGSLDAMEADPVAGCGAPSLAGLELEQLRSLRFSDQDVAKLEGQSAEMRVLALAARGWFIFVEPERWKQWVRDAAYPEGFPSGEFLDLRNNGERIDYLAQLSNGLRGPEDTRTDKQVRNGFSQQLLRGGRFLNSLEMAKRLEVLDAS